MGGDVSRFGDDDDAGLDALRELEDGGEIGLEGGGEDDDGGAKVLERGAHFFERLALGDDAEIVLHREHLGGSGAEDGLIVSKDDFEHGDHLSRTILYWSMTQADARLRSGDWFVELTGF